ncbi:hypothetical protein BC941DRAFT_474580 [Chlamydoabsidia padenii]|nr:hypothetical protein BC941DRAFT_474580 [Chlamydoabsidia padenii]
MTPLKCFCAFCALVMRNTLAMVLLGQVFAEGDNFCVYFYKQPNQQVKAGFICGSLNNAGDHVGRPNANIPAVASLTAPDWLQITLYDNKTYTGQAKTLKGDQDNISPAFNVQSFKLLHL